MNHDRTYRPVPYAPALRLRDADNSIRPHTYGVRVCSCTSIATEPCRPTACVCAGSFTVVGIPDSSFLTPNWPRHPDHLGSSSWITTTNGTVKQHLHYLPWGEEFVNQRSSHFDGVRYTFSAKEKDSETGLSYFGSRYYSSDLSIWLSVDPMSDKYPSLSPYTYCADNPVKLLDPNGNFPIIPFLIKAGINAMADCLMQAAMNYYFNPQTAGDLRAFFLNINGWITLKSGAEGAIPWKIPGGKAGRAAVTAAGDVLAYFCASPKQYTTKQALEDFTVGFIGELAGGGLSDLIAKYGAPAVAKGLCRIPGFSVNKIRGLTGYNLVSDYAQNLTKRLK